MLTTTLPRLKCTSCSGRLQLSPAPGSAALAEIRSGDLSCQDCRARFLILAGVALLVEDTHDYLLAHAKGISKIVPDGEIPAEFREDFLKAKSELETEHIEEDLEADRVSALYLMNHYLRADSKPEWWKPLMGTGSPLIDQLVREHWDRGPFAQIQKWVSEIAKTKRFKSAFEFGCGVGGLHQVLQPYCDFYLGADSSFASIALARHLALGVPYPGSLRIPEDLLKGPISREIKLAVPTSFDGCTDFVVTDFQNPAIAPGWDLTLALNMIDMLEEPEGLPRLQAQLLEDHGTVIQSCPYIWHEAVAEPLRAQLPPELRGDSARAVEWLYREEGFEIGDVVDHRPWLFFKHIRQLEIYSVHMFTAIKKAIP